MRRVWPRRVIELRVPVPSPLRREVEDMINGAQEVETPLFEVLGEPRVASVEVTQRPVTVPGEDRHCGVLVSLAVLAQQIILERVRSAAQETQIVPPSRASMISQRGRIGGGA